MKPTARLGARGYSQRTEANMKTTCIDIHTHAFPDGLAARAIATLEKGCPWKATGNGTVAGLLASMDQAGVQVSVLCPIATRAVQTEGILAWCREIRTQRIIPLPSIHPDTPDPAIWIRRFADEGFLGIKFHPMYQNFKADEPRLAPIYQAASDCGLFVTSHCGKDIAFPLDDDRAAPDRFARVMQQFSKLKLVCTHMGGWKDWDAAMTCLVGKDCYLETSMSMGQMQPEQAREMIARHGYQRVLLGSDWPWQTQQQSLDGVRALGLPPEQTQAILGENARALLGI